MKNFLLQKTLLLLSATGLLGFLTLSSVKAEIICKVTDPTGTPLNVRDKPNGHIINVLKNGRQVDILKIAYDSQNRPWAKVGGYYNGKYRVWGWVIREFISCYQQ
ncbi:SH3 domain-containing protein [Chlorogloeopsis sp. ULAP02]|uniref:SH3 domain-containing protein n=1 Tax=Chlorogloeopsis sp. ULAP02 TaxID=3107926 RepID=UPI003136F3AD